MLYLLTGSFQIGRTLQSTSVGSKFMQLPETPPDKPHAPNSAGICVKTGAVSPWD